MSEIQVTRPRGAVGTFAVAKGEHLHFTTDNPRRWTAALEVMEARSAALPEDDREALMARQTGRRPPRGR